MLTMKSNTQGIESSQSQSQSIYQSIHEEDNQNCISLPKIRCAFHPNEAITNFCTCQCCLLPLCPSCIKIHTNEHVNMKKINPQYEPITDLLEQIYGEVQDMLSSSSEHYRKISQIDARVGTFRATIQQKISSVKQSILNQVQKYFAKIDQDLQQKIDNMNYIQMLGQYKDQTKKTIIGLKNIEKCFNPDNDKIMRTVIKYKSGDIKRQVQEFERGLVQFLKQSNNNFITFSVREDYKQVVYAYLDSMKKIQLSDVHSLEPIANISNKLREVYDKSPQENKKQIIKSIGNILGNSGVKKQNQQNQCKDYLSNQISRTMSYMSRNGTPSKQEQQDSRKRRSSSKGKGLSLMQINNTFNTGGKILKAVNICQPIQFNKTTIIRRDK